MKFGSLLAGDCNTGDRSFIAYCFPIASRALLIQNVAARAKNFERDHVSHIQKENTVRKIAAR